MVKVYHDTKQQAENRMKRMGIKGVVMKVPTTEGFKWAIVVGSRKRGR